MQSHVPSSFMLRSFSGNSGAPLPPLTFASELTPYFFANQRSKIPFSGQYHTRDRIQSKCQSISDVHLLRLFGKGKLSMFLGVFPITENLCHQPENRLHVFKVVLHEQVLKI